MLSINSLINLKALLINVNSLSSVLSSVLANFVSCFTGLLIDFNGNFKLVFNNIISINETK